MEKENKIILGDYEKILSDFPDGFFSHFISDVPYKTIPGGTPIDSRRPTGILEKNDGKIFKNNDVSIAHWLPMVKRVVKEDGNFLIFTNLLNLFDFIEVIQNNGLEINEILLWTKNNVTPNRWYMKQIEYIIFASKNPQKAPYREYIFENVKRRIHPTEKPILLMEALITDFSEKGDSILDCFCGSGSTLIAAKNLDRDFFGCEIEPEYYEIAKSRLNL